MSVVTKEEPQEDTLNALDPTFKPMISTTADDVRTEDWLETFGMGKYADALRANGYDPVYFLKDLSLVEIHGLIIKIEISEDDESMFIKQIINLDIYKYMNSKQLYVCLRLMQKMHTMEISMKDQELNHKRCVIRQTNILLTDAKRKNKHALEQVASYKRLELSATYSKREEEKKNKKLEEKKNKKLEENSEQENNDLCEMLIVMKNELVTIHNTVDTQVNTLEAQKKAQKKAQKAQIDTQKAQKTQIDELTEQNRLLTEQNRLLTKQLNHANKQITAQITAQNTAQNEQDTKDIPRARFGTRNCLLNMFDSL